MFALLVPSCSDKSGTSCYHFVTRLMSVTADLLQVVPTKLLQVCCHQLFKNNLLRTICMRTRLYISLILICRRRRRCHCLRSVKKNIDKRFYSSMINDNGHRRRRRHMRIRLYIVSLLQSSNKVINNLSVPDVSQ